MNSILDNECTLFFDKIYYENKLNIIVRGAMKEAQKGQIQINNQDIGEGYAVVSNCNKYLIEFRDVILWQVVQESYTCFDPIEKRDSDNAILVYSQSKFLDFANNSFVLFNEMNDFVQHFCICTEEKIIDILASEEPKISLIPGNPSCS